MFFMGCLCIFFVNSVCFWLTDGKPMQPVIWGNDSPIVDKKDISNDSIWQWSQTFSTKSEWILHLPQPENYNTSLSYVMALIQIAINRTLWMLAVIALVYMLYCGAMVFFSGADDKNASKGKKWIYTAWIALAWIWLSRFIISAIIWFINLIAK